MCFIQGLAPVQFQVERKDLLLDGFTR